MGVVDAPVGMIAGRRSHSRFGILALIFVGTIINYLERTILGIAAPAVRTDLGIDAVTMGIVFSAFAWTYAAAQVPGGIFLDRFGTKLTYFFSVTFWSLFTLLQAFATGLYSLIFFRFGLGISEAPCFPANSRIVGTWFPQQERATATGIYTVGEYIGLVFFSPALFWLMAAYIWHALFIVVGVIGLLFGVVWWAFFANLPITAAIWVLAGGWLSDELLKRFSANIGRKTPIIAGLLLASLIITANYIDSDYAVIAILSVAFFGQGMVGLGWTMISDVAPKGLMGLTGGLFNLATNLAGIITPIVIGFIISATGSFAWALVFVGAVALLGAISYIFVLGDVVRIELDVEA